MGRFTQEDPYRGDGLNLYAYCANNPVTYSDPSGYACSFNAQAEENAVRENATLQADEAGGTQGNVKGGSGTPKTKADFYVTPSGDVIPSTGYRYVSENAPYLNDMLESMMIPANNNGTYLSFDNYDIANPGALQVPHDASVKVSFDTLQIIDDINIPYGNWGKASHLEPITSDFPQFGPGGATQVITHSQINIDTITPLPKN